MSTTIMYFYEIQAESPEKRYLLIDALTAQGARNVEYRVDGVTAMVDSPVPLNFTAMCGLESHREIEKKEGCR